MTEKVLGIIGGMGPEATVDLMQRIIRLTPARDDVDHIRCIVDNNPKVPSRIKAIIEGGGEDPGPVMADMARRLEAWGADFLVVACNTAHYYYEAVQDAVSIPVINLIKLVTSHIRYIFPDVKKVGLLASPAVAMTGIYAEQFKKHDLTDVWPDPEEQERLLQVIKDVKKGHTGSAVRNNYKDVCASLALKGAEIVVVACTELSALDEALPIASLDAAEILAAEIVRTVKKDEQLIALNVL